MRSNYTRFIMIKVKYGKTKAKSVVLTVAVALMLIVMNSYNNISSENGTKLLLKRG